MMRRWRLTMATFGLAAVLFTAGGLGILGDNAGGAASDAADVAPDVPAIAAARGDLSGAIAALQARLKLLPRDANGWASLGFAYVEQAKATVNPDFYPKAEGALRRSLAIDAQDNFIAPAGMAALAAARHQFAQARTWARRGLAINPSNPTLYGALADAETQLGNYDASMTAIQRMLDIRPDADSFARASYSWELRGDIPQARTLMERALESSASANQKAFARYYLGELALNSGDAAGALTHYNAGLAVAPNYAALYEGRAKAALALGDTDGALRDFVAAVERVPQPTYLIEYGELLESLGRTEEANAQYQLFETEQKLFAVNGVVADVDPTLFYADHGAPARALQSAQAGLASRPFIEMQDAYAWALHRNGRDAEALTAITKALALGTKNALFEFHAGAIQSSLGNGSAAQAHYATALAFNPVFHPLHAPEARAALASAK